LQKLQTKNNTVGAVVSTAQPPDGLCRAQGPAIDAKAGRGLYRR